MLKQLSIAGLVCLLSSPVYAEDISLGHDYARKQTREAAQASFVALEKTVAKLLSEIRSANASDESDSDEVDMVQLLEHEQNAWASYRDSHCQLETNIYVYPEGSMLFIHELNSCLLRFNRERQKYLEGLAIEFKQ